MKKWPFILFVFAFKFSMAQKLVTPYIKESFQTLVKNSWMQYSSKVTLPTGEKVESSGVMSFLGDYYYDSSNVHFIFLNKKWCITADHSDKTIKVISVDAWKKEFGQYGKLNVFDFLLDTDSNLFEKTIMKLDPLDNDEYYLHIQSTDKKALLQKLNIKYSSKYKIPIEYSGQVLYPTEYEEKFDVKYQDVIQVPISYATIDFSITGIRYADKKLFDDSRLIEESRGKAKIKVYRNYITTISSETKKSKK